MKATVAATWGAEWDRARITWWWKRDQTAPDEASVIRAVGHSLGERFR